MASDRGPYYEIQFKREQLSSLSMVVQGTSGWVTYPHCNLPRTELQGMLDFANALRQVYRHVRVVSRETNYNVVEEWNE